jgi:hypothetical protein
MAARARRLRAWAPRRAALRLACQAGMRVCSLRPLAAGAQWLRRLCPRQIEAFLDQYLLAHVVPKA